MKTAIVNVVGFDGGGIAKLGIEYSKIGLDVYFNDVIQPLQFKPNDCGNIKVFSFDLDIDIVLSNYDRIIFLPLTINDKDLEKQFCKVISLRKRYQNVEFCYLYCGRKLKHLMNLLELQAKYNFTFDHYFSITPKLLDYVESASYLIINAYTFPNIKVIKPLEDRTNVVFTAGRVESVKGVTAYFQSINNEFFNGEYIYIHEGAKFSINKSGTVSTSPQLFTVFDMTKSPKCVKAEFDFAKYGDPPKSNKLTIYPSYCLDYVAEWSKYYAGICCILGTKSKSVRSNNLFSNSIVATDKIEESRLVKQEIYWNTALEYVNLEMIAYGVPVLFSNKYANLIGFNDDRLIYNKFTDIPQKVHELKTYYDDARNQQYDWIVNNWKSVNSNIVKEFTKEFK